MNKIPFYLMAGVLALGCTRMAETPVTDADAAGGAPAVNAVADIVPESYAVRFIDEPADSIQAAAMLEDVSLKGLRRMFRDGGKFEQRHREAGLHLWYVVDVDSDAPTATKASSLLSANRHVREVERVYRPTLMAQRAKFPFNDPRCLSLQWHYFNDSNRGTSVPGCDIRLFEAWTIETGSPEIVVAVLDEGADFLHEDLAANMWINLGEIPDNGKDDDNNGYVDDYYGYDFVNNRGRITPGEHGTHTSGTIAAVNNNGVGVCGIAGGDGSGNGVRIMTLQNFYGQASASMVEAFVYAADNGACITSNSWGFEDPSVRTTPSYLRKAINYFNEYAGTDDAGNQNGPMKGGLAIFAAGNENRNYGAPACDTESIAVAAVGNDFVRAYYSNYGSWVDITAPGGDMYKGNSVYSTVSSTSHSSYAGMQGTSMACPHVSGVAALVLSKFGGPGYTRKQLEAALIESSNPIIYEYNPDYQGQLGHGLLDAYKALGGQDILPRGEVDVKTVKSSVKGMSATLSWTVPERKDAPDHFDIYYSKTPFTQESGLPSDAVRVNVASTLKSGETFTCRLDNLNYNTKYYFTIDSWYGEYHSGIIEAGSFQTDRNIPPVVTLLNPDYRKSIRQYESEEIRLMVTDGDGHQCSVNVDAASSPAFSYTYDAASGMLVITVKGDASYSGSWTATVSAYDGYDMSNVVTLPFAVEQNLSPVIVKSLQNQVFESESTVQINLNDYFTDPNRDVLRYQTVNMQGSDKFIMVINSGSTLAIKPKAYGEASVTVEAVDPMGVKVTQEIRAIYRNTQGLKNSVDVYPNPVRDSKLYIRTSGTLDATVTLFSKWGDEVLRKSVRSSAFEPAVLDISDLSAGTYSLRFEAGEGFEYSTVIVKL